MKTEEVKSLKLELEGQEADHFKSAIKKLYDENTKAGFTASNLTADEKKVLGDINQSVNK